MNKALHLSYFLFYLTLYIFCWSSVHAQTDKKAEQILTKSRNKISSAAQLTAQFSKTLQTDGKSSKPLTASGKVKLKKNKFRVDMSDQVIFCDGKKLWSYLVAEKEVTVSSYDPDEGFSPDRMFKLSQKDMKLRYDGQENVNGTASEKLSLFPISKEPEYFKIEYWVSNSNNFPAQVKIWNRNGSIVTYTLSSIDTQTTLPDTEFSFDAKKYPGVEVIDNQ